MATKAATKTTNETAKKTEKKTDKTKMILAIVGAVVVVVLVIVGIVCAVNNGEAGKKMACNFGEGAKITIGYDGEKVTSYKIEGENELFENLSETSVDEINAELADYDGTVEEYMTNVASIMTLVGGSCEVDGKKVEANWGDLDLGGEEEE